MGKSRFQDHLLQRPEFTVDYVAILRTYFARRVACVNEVSTWAIVP